MSRTTRVLFAIVVALSFILAPHQTAQAYSCKPFSYTETQAKELFGWGTLQGTNNCYGTVYGRIVSSWDGQRVVFRFSGSLYRGQVDGYLWQTRGPIIYDRATETGPNLQISALEATPVVGAAGTSNGTAAIGTSGTVSVHLIRFHWALNGGEFQGWIYFRGHRRPMCGGVGYIPKICMDWEP